MVCEQTCSCGHKVDQILWQTLGAVDLIHSSRMWIQTIMSCGKYTSTMQIRIVSGLWFCGRSRRLQINIRWTFVYFWKLNICTNKLDVQETDLGLTQLNRSRAYTSWCRVFAWMEYQLLISRILSKKSFTLLQPTQKKTKDQARGNSSRDTTSNQHTQKPN